VGGQESRGVFCGYLPVLWEGVSKARKQEVGTYDKVDGLGEAPVGDGAKRARLLVRDTLGVMRMSALVEKGWDGIP
jgi:hypothetical protein